MTIALQKLLHLMVNEKGSDLHLVSNSSPMIRIRADLVKVEMPPLPPQEVEAMIEQITTPEQRTALKETKSIDFAYVFKGLGVFRVNVFMQRHGFSITMRALPEQPPALEEMGMPEALKHACYYSNGMVLVTGPTGSGKSTTLAAMIDFINRHQNGHIITLEDPIEFQHETNRCLVNQRQLGVHFRTYAEALKASLREDPDVILVGEMRDVDTMAMAIKAAETGHLVFATLHTNSAAKSVDRIIDSFPHEQQNQCRTMLCETLKMVISQKLIPTVDGKRRICLQDVLVVNAAVANLIREGKTYQIQSIMQTARTDGMQIMDRSLLEAVRAGEVDRETALEHANDKTSFFKMMGSPTGDYTSLGAISNPNASAPAPTPAPGSGKKSGS